MRNAGTREHVILLHGLWMRAFTLAALRRRLEQASFLVHVFDYASVSRECEASIDLLLQRMHSCGSRNVHLVGHSLGGIVALRALEREPGLTRGRVVCLGSPLCGSAVARSLARIPGGAVLVGRNLELLCRGIERWDGRQAVGAIAGRLPIGFGFAFGTLTVPHDGTVSVAETALPGLDDHVVIPATHTGLLFSSDAAGQTIAFLRDGRFVR